MHLGKARMRFLRVPPESRSPPCQGRSAEGTNRGIRRDILKGNSCVSVFKDIEILPRCTLRTS